MVTQTRILNDHIVIQTPNPGQIKAVFPQVKEATVKGQPVVAVPYSLEAVRVLANMGIKADSPIRTRYDWPGRFKPRWYQTDTADFFTVHRRAHCHNAPRTGKTLSALWAADYLRRTGKIRRTLIVAPLSTLWDVWEQNIFEHFPLRTFATLHGSRQKRLDLLAKPHDFYIINHHGVDIVKDALALRPDIDHVIIDELAVFRNGKQKKNSSGRWGHNTLFAALNTVLNKQGIDRSAWGLTGTPTPQNPTDAYGQSKLICPSLITGSYTTFKCEVMLQVDIGKWVPKRGSEDTAARVLSPSIRFERSVCTDLEPCSIHRRAELSPEQQQHYKALLRHAVTEIRGSAVTAVNAAVLIQKIVQTACGCVYGVDGEFLKIDFGPRLKVLEELIEENDEKVLVFVPFTGALEAVASALRKRWSVEVVDGGTSPGKRNQIFMDFRSKKDPHVLVCHPQCMAHGLDLTAASLSIWYAPYWRAEVYQQANARTDGSKQTAKIDIAHIYATPEEHRIYKVLQEKGRLQDAVLELLKGEKR